MTQQEIVALLKENDGTLPQNVYAKEPNLSVYDSGTLSDKTLQVSVNRLNAIRKLAGLPAVTIDAEYPGIAQHLIVSFNR